MRRVLPWMAAALAFLALLVTTPPPRDAFAALFATTAVPSGRAEPAPSSATASTALEGTAEAQPRRGEAGSVEERTYWFEDGGFVPWAHREKRVDGVGRERGGWFHYVNDPIGTPERLVDERGEVAAEYKRKAWGELEALPGARASTPVRLQGQYADEETGLAYNRWRYFDASNRTWIRSDPIGLRGGPNQYGYVRNPFTWVDPLGLADPGLPELIEAFERRYPGRPYQTGHTRRHSDGREIEIEFETDNVIIEVKGGGGKGLGRQVTDRRDCGINPSGKPVVGYSATTMGKHARAEIESRGGIAADRSQIDTLMDAIAPDP